MRGVFLGSLFFCILLSGLAQDSSKPFETPRLKIAIDSLNFSDSLNTLTIDNTRYLHFTSNEENPLIALSFYFTTPPVKAPKLLNSDNYLIIDSLKKTTNKCYVAKVKLKGLIANPRPVIAIDVDNNTYNYRLLSTIQPVAAGDLKPLTIFQEEQQTIEIPVTNSFNVKSENSFVLGHDFDYKYITYLNFIELTIKPHTIGSHQISIPYKTFAPILDKQNNVTTVAGTLNLSLNVRPYKLTYLNFDRAAIFYTQDAKSTKEIMLDYNPLFEEYKFFRIENKSGSGGDLIAELTIESIVDNTKKVVGRIKPLAFHTISEGYLYLKDGDKSRFICNLNIIEKPKIEKIALRKDGDDWDDNVTVHPGDQFELRVQGKGLESNKIQFDGLTDAKFDSLRSSDEFAFFKIKIPMTISVKHITLLLGHKETAFQLNVKDFLKPAPFDFVAVNYNKTNVSITDARFNKPYFYDSTVKDINISFNSNKIDQSDKLYGKQYISCEVKILNKDNDLIEVEKIENIVVCPGDASPRKGHYDNSDANQAIISLNDYLDHKTYKLPEFTQIILTFSHDENKYDDAKEHKKKIKIILSRRVNYDLQLSFPTGLLVKNFGDGGGIGNLSGVSASVLFNITPYDESHPGQLRPYSIGAGFLALNALNLSNSTSTDLGIVVMGTIQPFRKNTKFSVPIYFGYGYFVKSGKFFEILGPGLQLNF